jgi:hypothetical protein
MRNCRTKERPGFCPVQKNNQNELLKRPQVTSAPFGLFAKVFLFGAADYSFKISFIYNSKFIINPV